MGTFQYIEEKQEQIPQKTWNFGVGTGIEFQGIFASLVGAKSEKHAF